MPCGRSTGTWMAQRGLLQVRYGRGSHRPWVVAAGSGGTQLRGCRLLNAAVSFPKRGVAPATRASQGFVRGKRGANNLRARPPRTSIPPCTAAHARRPPAARSRLPSRLQPKHRMAVGTPGCSHRRRTPGVPPHGASLAGGQHNHTSRGPRGSSAPLELVHVRQHYGEVMRKMFARVQTGLIGKQVEQAGLMRAAGTKSFLDAFNIHGA